MKHGTKCHKTRRMKYKECCCRYLLKIIRFSAYVTLLTSLENTSERQTSQVNAKAKAEIEGCLVVAVETGKWRAGFGKVVIFIQTFFTP